MPTSTSCGGKITPGGNLFGLLREANYEGWTMAEIPESADAVRLLRYYRALWRELTRP
jgi:hypothetical protein